MTASNSFALAAGALLFLVPASALADPPPAPAPSEEQVQAARVPYKEARELHRQGRLKEALERGLEAYRIASTPVTALEAGHLLVEAGRLVEAREIMRSVALFPVSPRESEKGREARQEAAALGATLDARIPKVAIAGRGAGMEVILDGKPFAASDPAAWVGLDPGGHTLVVRAGERTCTTIGLTLAEAEARTIDLHDATAACHLEAPPATAAEGAPPPPAALPVSPAPREAGSPSPPLVRRHEATASGWRWAGVVAAGAGAVALGVGGGVALGAKGSYDSVAAECPARGCTPSAYDVRVGARSQADAATAVMIAGAAAVGGGALILFLAPSRAASSAGSPAVGIGLGSARIATPFE